MILSDYSLLVGVIVVVVVVVGVVVGGGGVVVLLVGLWYGSIYPLMNYITYFGLYIYIRFTPSQRGGGGGGRREWYK